MSGEGPSAPLPGPASSPAPTPAPALAAPVAPKGVFQRTLQRTFDSKKRISFNSAATAEEKAAKGGATEFQPGCSRQKRRGLSVKQHQHTCSRRTNLAQTCIRIHTCAHTHTLICTTRTHMHTHTHNKRETKTHMHTHIRACACIHLCIHLYRHWLG